MKYDLTVGIVGYNEYSKTKEAIRSILEHTQGIRYQIYLVDNASRDGSAQRLSEEFPSVSVVFSDRNLGFGGGHNLLLDKIDSDFHAIVNPDIIINSDVLSQIVGYMRDVPEVALVTPKIKNIDGSPQNLPKRNPKLRYLIANRMPLRGFDRLRKEYRMMDQSLADITDIEFASGCFMVVRTDIFKEIGGFDERYFMYFEDADLTRTIRKLGYRTVYTPYVYVLHDYQRASAKKLKFLLIHIGSMCRYFFKWRGKQEEV